MGRRVQVERTLFELGARLLCCAQLVRAGTKLADVGTDHGYLPIWLARRGLIASAIAADVNEGPIQAAQANIRRYCAADRVTARLSDGLDAILPNEADDIVMAGMGGELIARLIQRAPWLKSEDKRLILQPMTSAEDLRNFLLDENYGVLAEKAVLSGKHVYTVMLAAYGAPPPEDRELFPYIGLLRGETEASRAYLNRKAASLKKQANGLLLSGDKDGSQRLFCVIDKIEKILVFGEGEGDRA